MLPLWGSCRGATEGANAAYAVLAPSGPPGHLPQRGRITAALDFLASRA